MNFLFACFMDWVVYPVVWVFSPRMRAHQVYVRWQSAHLDGWHKGRFFPGCAMCREVPNVDLSERGSDVPEEA